MSATYTGSVLKSLEIDSARVEALSEPDLCELIGFIEYDSRLHPARRDDLGEERRDEAAPVARSAPVAGRLADASCLE
ncbi:MAG TPA: hypothetical protein VMV69_01230 [Pirellulales bacterium]|nr:hypothetical protein [Pirellulales bacterium]